MHDQHPRLTWDAICRQAQDFAKEQKKHYKQVEESARETIRKNHPEYDDDTVTKTAAEWTKRIRNKDALATQDQKQYDPISGKYVTFAQWLALEAQRNRPQ